MAASVVQTRAVSVSSASSVQLTLLSTTTPGNVVVVQMYMSSNTRTAVLSDNSASGQTWTSVGAAPADPTGSDDCRQYVWRCVVDEAFSTLTATITGGSVSSAYLHAIEVGGVDGTPSVVAQEAYMEASDPLAATGITTDAADQFLVACMCKDSASEGWSTSPDWTSSSAVLRTQILTRDAPTAGAYGCSINWASSASRDVVATFLAFPVSAGGDPTPTFRYIGTFF